MKHIVCFSGGHSSALAAIETVRKYGRENVVLLNHDISPIVEHEDIKRFKRETADYLGLPITYANMPGYEHTSQFDVCTKLGSFHAGKPGYALCTAKLKTEPFHRWLKWHGEAGDNIIYGFDINETQRMARRTEVLSVMGYKAVFPLADWDRTIHDTEEVGIARPVTYETYKHANCIGCLKAGRQHWYCVFCLRPDIWEAAKAAETTIGYSIIKGVYLKDLEPKFQKMRDELHIIPTDKINSARFWADVRRLLPEDASTKAHCGSAANG